MSSPKPKRPGGKHRSSFIQKFHKRHDERHHAGEGRHTDDEEQPLFREEHPDSHSEIEARTSEEASTRSRNYTEALTNAGQSAKSTLTSAARRLSEAGKNSATTVSGGISRFGTTARDKFSSASSFIKKNPKCILAIACGALLLLAIGEAVDIFMHRPLPYNNATDLCTTPACVHAASTILANLHPSYEEMNPCDNFEQYVCGGFSMQHELRDDQGSIFTGTLIEDDLYATLRHILERDRSEINAEDQQIFSKVKDAYTACIDEDKLEEYGARPLKNLVEEIRSQFGSDDSALRKSPAYQVISGPVSVAPDTLSAPLIHMAKLDISALVLMTVKADIRESGSRMVLIAPSKPIGLPAGELYQDKEVVASYTAAVEASLSHFIDVPGNTSAVIGRHGLRTTLKDLTRGVVLLESRLASIMPSDDDLSDASQYDRLTLEQFDDAFPQMSLSTAVRELGPSDYNISSVIVPSTKYLRSMSKLVASTAGDILQAFLIWKTVQSYSDSIKHESVDLWTKLSQNLAGKEPNAKEERWRTCVKSVNQDFGWILSRFYVQTELSAEFKTTADQVGYNITEFLGQRVLAAAWMAFDDQMKTLEKVKTMSVKIGFPTENPDVRDSAALEDFYKRVVIEDNTHFENKIQSARASVQRQWSKLGQPNDQHEWSMTSTTIDAYYDPLFNEIVLPAAIIRKPMLYEPDVPVALTYGAFGAISGHEMNHAFDHIGSKYDKNGTISHWWSDETRSAFEERAQCFEDQYSQYAVNGPDGKIYVNGTLTLDESIADATGIRSAYTAWMAREARRPSKLLPGLATFDQKQLFWLSYGN